MNENQPDCLRIPVVIGVMGHIDIAQDEAWVFGQLEKFWSTVRHIVGKETPVVLLSSIAQGADHYVVKSMPADIKRYCVVLPFAQVDYEQDFVKYAQKPNALEEFHQDLAGAFKVIQCDATVGDYTVASDYVRSHSDILITLWDGYESLGKDKLPQKGGTYHQICIAWGMDEQTISRQEKTHVIVNLTVSRKSEHKEFEKRVCTFPEGSTLNVLSWNKETREFSITPLEEWMTFGMLQALKR